MALSYIAKKGFYDNVDHGKLLKQMWTMGIRDKNLLCIISAMLRAEIEGIGIPSKGVPQGGICSPLFLNVVLNELGAIVKIMAKGKALIKKIQKNPNPKNISLYNSYVLGTQNYYRIATHCTKDFSKIGYTFIAL